MTWLSDLEYFKKVKKERKPNEFDTQDTFSREEIIHQFNSESLEEVVKCNNILTIKTSKTNTNYYIKSDYIIYDILFNINQIIIQTVQLPKSSKVIYKCIQK